MSPTTYLWNPPPVYSVAVRGKTERMPIQRLFFVGRDYHAHAVEIYGYACGLDMTRRDLPGDLIFTGTPEGVGPLQAGDRIEGRIDGVGSIALNVGPAE
jgi:hypothetical protein